MEERTYEILWPMQKGAGLPDKHGIGKPGQTRHNMASTEPIAFDYYYTTYRMTMKIEKLLKNDQSSSNYDQIC
jgi:hypothetical protein